MRQEPPIVSVIRRRATLLRELRDVFDTRGFLEVQPPCLMPGCVADAFIDPIEIPWSSVRLPGPDATASPRLFLQTSPELAMKQMLAAGAPSIYSIGPVFRGGESGPQHRVEFTMLEWYEVGGDERSAIALIGAIAGEILGPGTIEVRDYRRLFADHCGLDPLEADVAELRRLLAASDPGLAASVGDDRDGLLEILFAERVQPHLGHDRPLVVRNYPLTQAALAKTADDDPDCAARFEWFVDGVELANGYDELLDPDELVRRTARHNRRRESAGRPALPLDQGLLAAMRRGLPPSAGVALGVDRLQMIRERRDDLGGCGFDALHPPDALPLTDALSSPDALNSPDALSSSGDPNSPGDLSSSGDLRPPGGLNPPRGITPAFGDRNRV